MASRSVPPCTHELRPGTTLCLRCQHAERAAQRARQRQLLARGAAGTLVLVVIAAVGIAGATALRARLGARTADKRTAGDPPTTRAAETNPDSTPGPVTASESAQVSSPVQDTAVAAVAAAAKPAGPTPPAATPAAPNANPAATPEQVSRVVAPLVPVGRTALRDTMVVDRAGDTVRVSFDLVLSRTRRADKFEAIVRSTLPQVYGAPADSALRALPVGAVARAGDLMTTLPQSGFRIPLADGRAISVWPETRAGRDGPLVVAYRAVAAR